MFPILHHEQIYVNGGHDADNRCNRHCLNAHPHRGYVATILASLARLLPIEYKRKNVVFYRFACVVYPTEMQESIFLRSGTSRNAGVHFLI